MNTPDSNLERVHIVITINDKSGRYSQHAGVLMVSIFENTRNPVSIYIFHDDTLTNDNRQKFIHTAENYNQDVKFISVEKYIDQLNYMASLQNYPVGSLYRLLIPEMLPELERVVYLDCDIVVNLDIAEIWSIDTENCSMAGVRDMKSELSYELVRCKMLGCDRRDYVNAGVLLMNLASIRKIGDLFRISYNWYVKYLPLVIYVDQDVLNVLFHGQKKFIDQKFNDIHPELEQGLPQSIIHDKLWRMSGLPAQNLYWSLYLRSEWGKNKSPDDVVDILSDAAGEFMKSISGHYHPHPKICMRSALRAILRKIFCTNKFSASIILRAKYFIHRFRRKNLQLI